MSARYQRLLAASGCQQRGAVRLFCSVTAELVWLLEDSRSLLLPNHTHVLSKLSFLPGMPHGTRWAVTHPQLDGFGRQQVLAVWISASTASLRAAF